VAEGRRFADRFRPDRFRVIDNAGHLSMVENADRVTAELRELIRRVAREEMRRVA
jgi:pimeloyl-ACP methyl ester carboxylesterase